MTPRLLDGDIWVRVRPESRSIQLRGLHRERGCFQKPNTQTHRHCCGREPRLRFYVPPSSDMRRTLAEYKCFLPHYVPASGRPQHLDVKYTRGTRIHSRGDNAMYSRSG